MTSLTFFGGVNEIGGNKILVEDDANLFLDFGMSFSEYGKYFEEFIRPRSCNGFGDLVELGLIPRKNGIYRHDLLKISKFTRHEEPSVSGVLLSHMHLDHSSHIAFLDERIPIYCSKESYIYALCMIETGQRRLECEIANYKERPILDRRKKPISRNFKNDEKFKIENIEIEAFPVDHSILGANSYLIHSSEGEIFYTGDFRLHGGRKTEKMLEKVCDIDVMICEGTRIDEKKFESETQVYSDICKIMAEAKELTIADFSHKDITRFKTFLKAAKESNKKIVLTLKQAYLYEYLDVIDDDADILFFKEKKRTGLYSSKDYSIWERELMEIYDTIDAKEIHKNQKNLVVCLDFYSIPNLIDIKPKPGTIYIHSSSEAFNEEMEIDERRLNNWLKHFQIQKFHTHCSGHANFDELKAVVETLNPKKIVPIHTEKPELFKKFGRDIQFVKKGGRIEV